MRLWSFDGLCRMTLSESQVYTTGEEDEDVRTWLASNELASDARQVTVRYRCWYEMG